jgi:hypothetical protein
MGDPSPRGFYLLLFHTTSLSPLDVATQLIRDTRETTGSTSWSLVYQALVNQSLYQYADYYY